MLVAEVSALSRGTHSLSSSVKIHVHTSKGAETSTAQLRTSAGLSINTGCSFRVLSSLSVLEHVRIHIYSPIIIISYVYHTYIMIDRIAWIIIYSPTGNQEAFFALFFLLE